MPSSASLASIEGSKHGAVGVVGGNRLAYVGGGNSAVEGRGDCGEVGNGGLGLIVQSEEEVQSLV